MDELKMVVYSPAGHGKTHLIGSGCGDSRFSPILIADFEGGVRSIRSKVRQVTLDTKAADGKKLFAIGQGVKKEKIDVIRVRTWSDFDGIYAFLEDNPDVYKTFAIDSLSELNYLCLTGIVATAIEAAPTKHDPDIAERADYLRSANQMRKLIRYFRDLPMHTIFTCGASEAENPRTKQMMVRPNLTGKLVGEVPGLVDIVGYLAIIEEDNQDPYRALIVQPTERFMAKDRSEGGQLGTMVVDPTLPMILDILDGKVKAPKEKEKASA